MSEAKLTIRQARSDDRAAMERICAHTWDDGDYIPHVWDRWLADGQGPLIVGELEGQVAALCKITFQTPEQVWLQGMRVDPDHRQRGIGREFLRYSLEYAREQGARVARLSTGAHNTPVHRLTAQAGMERIGVYIFWQAEALPDGPQLAVLGPGDQATVEAFLRTSSVLEACHGVYQADWVWQDLSSEQLALLLQEGRVVALAAPGRGLAAVAILTEDREDQALDAGYADGDPAAVREMALALRVYAARLGATRARAWLPEVDWLREAFASAGYAFGEWHGEMWLLERRFDRFPDPSPLPGGEAAGEDHAR
jgi:GNAT superfamily N-acetyltransferase